MIFKLCEFQNRACFEWFLPIVSQYIWDFSGLIKVLKMIDEFCLLITSSSCQHWFGFSFQLYTFFQVSTALCTRPVENWWQEAKNSFKTFSSLIQILLCMKKTKKLYCWQQSTSVHKRKIDSRVRHNRQKNQILNPDDNRKFKSKKIFKQCWSHKILKSWLD